MTTTLAAETRRCATHPDVLAVDTCARCGGFVCGDCLELIREDPYCPTCYRRPDVTGRASTRARVALACSVAGLLCGPLSIAGLVLAGRERRNASAAPASTDLAGAAWLLGWMGVGVMLLYAIAVAAVLLL